MTEELSLLEAQLTYKNRLENIAAELRSQRENLSQKVAALEQRMLSEKKDVQRLEGRSLAAFYYHAFGKRKEKLEGERREYYAARVKYDAALRELRAVEQDLQSTEEDLQDLQDVEERYRLALEEKRRAIEASGTEKARELLEKKQQLLFLQSQERELVEAIAAGTKALRQAGDVSGDLKHLADLGAMDHLGGFLMDMAKQERLDEAQKNVEQLQIYLQGFNRELGDVQLRRDLQADMQLLLQFTDAYFDGLLTVQTPAQRLREAGSHLDRTREQIQRMLRQLQSRLEEVRHGQLPLQTRINTLILETQL